MTDKKQTRDGRMKLATGWEEAAAALDKAVADVEKVKGK